MPVLGGLVFWGAAAALGIFSLGVALWPALRASPPEPSAASRQQALLRRELDDIARDRALGVIAAPEADAAELEAKRRYLRAAGANVAAPAIRSSHPAPLLAAAALASVMAVSLYLVYGRPDLASSDPSQLQAQAEAIAALPPEQRMAQIKAMVDGLEARLVAASPEENEKAFDGWMRLGLARSQLGDYPAAARAFDRAVALDPESAYAQAMLGLSLAAENDGKLPTAALDRFEKALALDPDQSDALWHLGLHEAASGRKTNALKHWRRLLAGLDAGSSEFALVSSAIDALAKPAP